MLAALAAGTFVFVFALAGTYVAFGGATAMSSTFGQDLPSFYSAFAGTRDSTNLFAPVNYLALGFVHPLYLVLTLSVAVSIGTASVAGDVETGRAEMLFTAPVDRRAVLDARLSLWAVAQLAVVAAGFLGGLAGMLVSPDIRAVGIAALARIALQYLPLAALVGALAFAASAVSASRGRALGIAIGVPTFGYLLNFVGLLWRPADPLRWVSPFRYYVPARAAAGFEVADMAVLLGVSLVLVAGARTALQRRDLV
jgi:ABC-2 type transport system permease protein